MSYYSRVRLYLIQVLKICWCFRVNISLARLRANKTQKATLQRDQQAQRRKEDASHAQPLASSTVSARSDVVFVADLPFVRSFLSSLASMLMPAR